MIYRQHPTGEGEITRAWKSTERLSQRETHSVLPPERFPEAVNLIKPLTLVEDVVVAGLEAVFVGSHDTKTQEHGQVCHHRCLAIRYLVHNETHVLEGQRPALQIPLRKVSDARHILGNHEGVGGRGVEHAGRLYLTELLGQTTPLLQTAVSPSVLYSSLLLCGGLT